MGKAKKQTATPDRIPVLAFLGPELAVTNLTRHRERSSLRSRNRNRVWRSAFALSGL